MTQEVGQLAAAMTQVRLSPYDEEELAIWFRLIEAQFAVAGIKSPMLHTPMLWPVCPSKSFGTFWTQLMSAMNQVSLLIF
jgi:hypothetical protein